MSIVIIGSNSSENKIIREYLLNNTDRYIVCIDEEITDKQKNERLAYFDIDLSSTNKIRDALNFAKPSWLIYNNGHSSVKQSFENPYYTITQCVSRFLSFQESLRLENRKPKTLVVSSAEVYGTIEKGSMLRKEDDIIRPESPFASAKACIETIAFQYNKNFGHKNIIARPFYYTGSNLNGSDIIAELAKKLTHIKYRGKEPVIYTGNLEIERDVINFKDVIKAYHFLLEKGKANEIYNICSSQPVIIRWILEKMLRILDLKVEIRADANLGNKMDIPALAGDNSKLKKHTDWEYKTSIDETIEELIDYWKNK